MIEFDINKFRIENVHLKYVTKSRGGNMSILDTRNKTNKEKFVRRSLPAHVADVFQRQHKMNRFIKPVLAAVCYYENTVVALQLHPLGNLGKEKVETLFGSKLWISNIEHNIKNKLADKTKVGKWFIDGSVIYRYTNENNVNLTKDGNFQALEVDTYRLTELSQAKIGKSIRTCISYTTGNGKTSISPPIWRTLGTIGNKKVDHLAEDEAMTLSVSEHQFDKVDKLLAVNLNFALHAATVITDHFGYESIEPLRLDDLMVALKTVNLPRLNRSIKGTYDIGMKFTHAVAWVLGFIEKDMPLESYAATRSMLRYLTSRGIIHRTALSKKNVFLKGKNMETVPLLKRNDLEERQTQRQNELLGVVDITT